jgi:hypothetical protein
LRECSIGGFRQMPVWTPGLLVKYLEGGRFNVAFTLSQQIIAKSPVAYTLSCHNNGVHL